MEKTREASQLFLVIGSGALFGLAIVGFFLFFYGPTGQYSISNILLSPSTLEQLDQQEGKFSFDSISFHYYTPSNSQWKRVDVDRKKYSEFYQMIQGDRSLKEASEKVDALFHSPLPYRLVLIMQEKGGHIEVFQEVQIASFGDYYRVQLREDSMSASWAYFRHKGIGQTAVQLLGLENP